MPEVYRMTLETDKNLGGIGAILLVIGVLGTFGAAYAGVLSLVGVVLVLIALKGLADYYKEAGIFNNMLYGFIFMIVGVVAFVGAFVVSIMMAIVTGLDWMTDIATLPQRLMDLSNLWTILGTIIIALVVLFVFIIIAAIFVRKSLSTLSAKSGVGLFGTAGLLFLVGALLTIVLVGLILIFIAFILIAVGFFSIKPSAPQSPTATPPPA
jgi:uncharacterized membrane protein